MDGGVDGEAEVEEQQGKYGEVEERLEAGVVFVGLGLGHGFLLGRSVRWSVWRHITWLMVGFSESRWGWRLR